MMLSVIKFIADHGIVGGQQRLKQAAVRVKARGVENRVLRSQKRADAFFQLLVNRLRAANESDRRQTVSPVVEAVLRRRDDSG